MIRALGLAVTQLSDPRILRVLAKSLLLTLLLFAGIGWGLSVLLDGVDPCAMAGDYSCAIGGAESRVAAILLTIAAIWLLFPAIAIGVTTMFADEIVAAVEARHYPAAAAGARPIGWVDAARLGLGSGARLLLYNLIALPFYLLLLFTAIGPFILFLAVNAAALGRDLGEMVAVRHGDRAALRNWLAATRGRRWAMGLVATSLFLVPGLNLLAPVLSAAMATHVYHGSRA